MLLERKLLLLLFGFEHVLRKGLWQVTLAVVAPLVSPLLLPLPCYLLLVRKKNKPQAASHKRKEVASEKKAEKKWQWKAKTQKQK